MSLEYDVYLKEHVQNVQQGLQWMLDNLDWQSVGLDIPFSTMDFVLKFAGDHDRSKYSIEEYWSYDKYFYGKNRSHKVTKSFDYAWLHHQNHNPHHWQYWALIKDSGEIKPLEIPYSSVLEMIADWWSFSWKSGNLEEIFDWYDENKDRMILHPKTRKLVEDILEAMRTKLKEDKQDGQPDEIRAV